jgi:UDP-glucose 4-epimerase
MALGHEVMVIDNLSTGSRQYLHPQVDLLIDDVEGTQHFSLSKLFEEEKFDYVFHLAAQINLRHSITDPYKDANTNILGTINIADNCAKHNVKMTFMSTGGAIYSEKLNLSPWQNPWSEKAIADPSSPYGLSKLTAEKYVQMMSRLNGLKYTILRPSNIYGPRQSTKGEAGVVAIFIENVLQEKDLRIFGSGFQTRDFVYVSDVVSACLHTMGDEFQDIYNVSTGVRHNISYIARSVIGFMMANRATKHEQAIPGEMMHCCLSCDKLRQTGWSPKVSFDDGLKATIKSFVDIYDNV